MKNILKNKLYMTTMCVDMLSDFGDILFYLALMNYVLILPEPKFAIAIITLSETVPMFTSMFTGYFADKTKQKVNLIIGTLIFRTFTYILVGFVMGFEPALWVIIFVSIMNFMSDIAGQYESGLFTPLSLKIIPSEERERYYGFGQTVRQTLQIVFRSISAFLVAIISYQNLAFINAMTFLIAGVVMILISKQLKNLVGENNVVKNEKNDTKKKSETTLFKDMKNNFIVAYKELKQDPELFTTIMVAPLLNGMFVVMPPLTLLLISEDANFVIINSQITIALIPIIMTVFGILGSMLSMANVFKKWGLRTFVQVLSILAIFKFLALIVHKIYLVIFIYALISVVAMALQPKLNAIFLNVMPEKKLATIGGIVSTYTQIGMVFMTIVFSWLVTFLSSTLIILVFLIMMVLITTYTLFFMKVKGS